MRLSRRHAVHGFVWIAVLIQLGFAIAFLVDAAETNSTYDVLASHRVAVRAHSVGCATIMTGRNLFGRRLCRVDYAYSGETFTAVIPFGETATFFVDPQNTSYRMNEVNFEKGPQAITGDLVFVFVLLFGALAVTIVHLEHLRDKRSLPASHH
jgi:Na+/proline symporter